MRTDLHARGFTLYEILISITIVGILAGLLSVSLFPLLDRAEFVNTTDKIKNTLRQAQWLALTQLRSHRLKSESGNILLQRKNNTSFDTVFQEKVAENILISASRWPSFSAFGFAAGGTITLESETYSTKVIVSPIGRIRQTEIERR
ncbi:MAG: prepilin-type N-terminal cleavage/methylation domain-containing protein [SAR324 cluster bacterium]|nr:prepilin-type N-terminal cleavage/methylation domain-containing protein [SAR324 cluster bacterium]MBL7035938.1 prepilin-type N-terminal cleavage/methylation domain-containing protein [SAR324 cluster bacterium]